MKTFIYALTDPRDGAVKYVGKTINLKSRMKSHQSGIGKFRLGAWLNRLKEKKLHCGYKVLEEHVGDGWELRERYWIGYYRDLGTDLCNLSSGGEGKAGRKLSAESCQKLRDAFKGRPIPQKQREQISRSLTGLKQSPETITKRFATYSKNRVAKGLPPIGQNHEREVEMRREERRAKGIMVLGSEEHRRIAAEKQSAYYASLSDEQKEVIAAKRRGKIGPNAGKKFGPLSPGLKAKLSAIHKQRLASLTPEQRKARIAAARQAQPAAWRAIIESKTKDERRAMMAAADAANPMKQAIKQGG